MHKNIKTQDNAVGGCSPKRQSIKETPLQKTEKSVSLELAQWVSSLQYSDLNAELIRDAKRYLLDALAVAWAGSRAMGTEGAHAWVIAQGGKAESRVWLTNEYLPATSAAFINGIYAAALDFDSVHDQATSHPDIVIIPALMALADRQPMHGKDFLTAYIAGLGCSPLPRSRRACSA